MAMMVFRNCIALSLALMAAPLSANAQAARTSAVANPAMAAAVSPTSVLRWTCVSRAVIEIAPVSYDTAGAPSGWVVVHRVKGEIIASERVSDLDVRKLSRLPCGAPDSDLGGVAVIG
jgi:hypothetical protein